VKRDKCMRYRIPRVEERGHELADYFFFRKRKRTIGQTTIYKAYT